MKDIVSVILAAGKGTRMKSDLVKVLHPLLGVPMLTYPLELSFEIGAERTIVVAGHQAERVMEAFKHFPADFVIQPEQLGTGHAVAQAIPLLLESSAEAVLILCGDVPLLKATTVRSFLEYFFEQGSAISVMTANLDDPSGYGRIVRGCDGSIEGIVEERDSSAEQKSIKEINTGIYCIEKGFLVEGLKEIGRDNAQGEYYLTDLVEIARKRGLRCSAFRVFDPLEAMGINTRIDLAKAHEVLRRQKLESLMLSGVTVVDPKTTYVDRAVEIGKDSVLFPNCYIYGKTKIGERCTIESNTKITDSEIGNDVVIRLSCEITESRIEDGAAIGPFAHLRPLAHIKTNARIGNFVEVKKSVIGRGSKANHLTYIGDSIVGEDVNIGAGTITCNYDGYEKHQTVIEDNVFVGSNVELVAPVKVGKGASIGAGTTVTKDVPEGALAISRVKQKNIKGWAARVLKRRKKEQKNG